MVEKIDVDSILRLGLWLGRLEAAVNAPNSNWGTIRSCLQPLCRYKQIDGLEFIGSDAQGQLSQFNKKFKDRSKAIDGDDCMWIDTLIQQWIGRLDKISKRWIVNSPETQLDISKLTLGGEAFFEDGEWKVLSKLEQRGLNEAAKSLLVDNFTASEFMALRTIESVLRRWYKKKTGSSLGNVKWGNVLDKLDRIFPEKNRPTEISALLHLKRRRNAIAHPDVISRESDASVTFIYVINVCKAMKNIF